MYEETELQIKKRKQRERELETKRQWEWHIKRETSLQRSLWKENKFVNHVNLLNENQWVHVHRLEWNKVSCNQRALVTCPHNQAEKERKKVRYKKQR